VLPENFTVDDAEGDTPRLRERVVYPPLESTTRALERAAREGLDFDPLRPANPAVALAVLRGRAAQDPTNPFT
ncbi:hypothetical protein, partial [Deinococcus pimensis]|uniref:hypothetical protein n=1 Tax=Deinococcus pimensis TaxID=309888 RepID=UPI00047F16D3